MTTAGTAQVAFAPETDFNGSLSGSPPSWVQPGVDISVTGPTTERNQEAKRQPDETTPAAHRPGQLNNSATVEFALAGTSQDWEQFVFHGPDDNLPQQGGEAPSFKAFFGSQLLDGTAVDYVASGAIVTGGDISFEDGGDATVSLEIEFAEKDDSVSTPSASDITQPDAGAVYPYHSLQLEVGSTVQTVLDSATISFNSLHRLRYGLDQVAQQGVVDSIEPEAEVEGTFTEENQLNLATSGTGGGSLADTANLVFSLTNTNGDIQSYILRNGTPDSYDLSSLVDPEEDLTESVTFVGQDIDAGTQ